MRSIFSALLLLIAVPAIPMAQQVSEARNDFRKYFDQFKVDGSFVLYDLNRNTYTFYNKEQFKREFTPASTYKICNSLIGLETGIIPDENYVIKWDGTHYQQPEWNRDHSMRTAFKYSAVWYYQELARRVGQQKEKYWLDKVHYGNADTSGGIDRFWLTGGLRITPEQEIDFLERLYKNQLPFSRRSMDIVRKIMVVEETPKYILRAETGWGDQDSLSVGWYVGYVQTKENVYFFATCIQSSNPDDTDFGAARIQITRDILMDMHIIPTH